MWTYLLIIPIFFIYYVYKKICSINTYWSKSKIIGPKPSLIFGNTRDALYPQKYSIMTIAAKYYNDYPNEKAVGVYQALTPTLVVRDPEMIKTVIVKDFSHFSSRGLKVNNKNLNIFLADYDEWRIMRKDLTPSFTIGKLKAMVPLLNTCIEKHMNYMETNFEHFKPVEVHELINKYAITSISSVAFGVDFETYAETPTEIEKIASNLFKVNLLRRLGYLLYNSYSLKIIAFVYSFCFTLSLNSFFNNLVKEILKERENNPQERQNLMEKLIAVNKRELFDKDNNKIVTHNESMLSAQTLVLFSAGYESSSSSMSFFLYELALQPSIQARCQKEIDIVMEKYNGKPDFNALMKELPYVSMVMDETLRKYPIGGLLQREATTDYTFQDLNLTILKGTKLWCSILGLQNDSKYFEDPEKFDPDGFLPENFRNIQNYYYPFGDGPRNCIGMQFARLQFFMYVSNFLHKFKVSPCEKTARKIKFDPTMLTLVSEDGIWLNIEKRN